jgi:3-(3-hydroxy-phenyl)propionate hydroxylase
MPEQALPIFIAGAGPVGLTLALFLARRGVRTCVVETFTDENFLDQSPRTSSTHPSTLEILDDLGLYDKLEKRGLRAPTFQFWDRETDAMFAEFDHAVIREDTRFPFVLQCERIKIIEEMRNVLRASPECELRMGTTLQSVSQDGDSVTAVVTNPAGEKEEIKALFAISAEGARSIIRKSSGIEFEGYTYPERVLTVAVDYDFDKHHGYSYRNYLSDPEQWSNLFKWTQPDLWRMHFPTRIDDDPDVLLSDAYIQKQLQRFLPRAEPYEVKYRNLYTAHQLIANTFRAGRCILVGDAAHVNSPVGGVGMNSGIHDAVNLGEKLCSILRGESDLDVLDRYSRQRRHVALNHVKSITEGNKRLIHEKDPALRRQNHERLSNMAATPKLAREHLLRTSLISSLREAAAIA